MYRLSIQWKKRAFPFELFFNFANGGGLRKSGYGISIFFDNLVLALEKVRINFFLDLFVAVKAFFSTLRM
jgi:hypothetical protein